MIITFVVNNGDLRRHDRWSDDVINLATTNGSARSGCHMIRLLVPFLTYLWPKEIKFLSDFLSYCVETQSLIITRRSSLLTLTILAPTHLADKFLYAHNVVCRFKCLTLLSRVDSNWLSLFLSFISFKKLNGETLNKDQFYANAATTNQSARSEGHVTRG